MAKERMLTIMVPIRPDDAIEVSSLPAIDSVNVNKIYKYNGTYQRLWYDDTLDRLAYHEVFEREFPYLGRPLEIFDFSYDSTRMGNAAAISAQNVKWFADKDENGNDVTLEGLWSQDCHVNFNGEKLYLKQTPTCDKSNEDARYNYTIEFVSEHVVLEHVYFYDTVTPFVSERPTSESAEFSFYGDINELVTRINASLLRSGLASLELLPGVTSDSFLTYEEFNSVGLGTYTGDKDTSDPFPEVPGYHEVHNNVYEHFGGSYNKYLLNCVYVVENPITEHIGPSGGGYDEILGGNYVISGYQCKVGNDRYGELTTSEEKLIDFKNNTIHEALNRFFDDFGVQYYITRERDASGEFTGNIFIMVADCEHDFADMNASGTDFVRDDDGLPTTENPLDYGATDALLAKEKSNSTEKIVTRITGVGSEENIPWYYPNPTADGWIKPNYKTAGELQESIVVDYPREEGDTPADNTAYEKYLKNRIGHVFRYGNPFLTKNNIDFVDTTGFSGDNSYITLWYSLYSGVRANQRLLVNFGLRDGSNVDHYIAYLYDYTTHTNVDTYDSDQTYNNPTEFQQAFISGQGDVIIHLEDSHKYAVNLVFYHGNYTPYWPATERYDYRGYYYPTANIVNPTGSSIARVGDGFYNESGLVATGQWSSISDTPTWAGYSADGTYESRREPILRVRGKRYMDITSRVVYTCDTNRYNDPSSTTFQSGYIGYSKIEVDEWVTRYLTLKLTMVDANGWYKDRKSVDLSDYSLSLPAGITSDVLDTIEFQRIKYITPVQKLMPELYIKTDGQRRFYDAIQYPRSGDAVDEAAGENSAQVGGETIIYNPLYKEDESVAPAVGHYEFENVIMQNIPHEHIEEFDDVKPTIKGQKRQMTISGVTAQFRIDVVEEFEYDWYDNNEVWESNDDGNAAGEYKHPFVFAKLRPLGFNIFDLALQEDMIISMTTGHCGACNFKIGVDENTKKNPVQIWEYDVYEGPTYSERGDIVYHAGDLRRYVNTSSLHYDTDGTQDGYMLVDKLNLTDIPGFLVDDAARSISRETSFVRSTILAEQVTAGEVGSLRMDSRSHFEGDVKVNGRFIGSQQDTTDNFVWVALYKDTDSYGTIMPSAQPDYGDGNYSRYIEPKGHIYHNRKTGEDEIVSDDDADKFVILNIKMPQVYLRRAEHELSRKIVEYMYDNNAQKFNFSIKYSRIYLAMNESVDSNLNENSVVYIKFNNTIYRQYVKHYSYKMTRDAVLPEISVDLNEDPKVVRTSREREDMEYQEAQTRTNELVSRSSRRLGDSMGRRFIGRTDDTLVSGNIVSRIGVTSFSELNSGLSVQRTRMLETQADLEVNHYKIRDFEVFNGTDLKIGDDIHLPTAYQDGHRILRRKWSDEQKEFVTDSNAVFTPAFVDTQNGRLVQYKTVSGGESVDNTKIIYPAMQDVFDIFSRQVTATIEKRVMPYMPGGTLDEKCYGEGFIRYYYGNEGEETYFWLDEQGNEQYMPAECSASNGMKNIDIEWNLVNE